MSLPIYIWSYSLTTRPLEKVAQRTHISTHFCFQTGSASHLIPQSIAKLQYQIPLKKYSTLVGWGRGPLSNCLPQFYRITKPILPVHSCSDGDAPEISERRKLLNKIGNQH